MGAKMTPAGGPVNSLKLPMELAMELAMELPIALDDG
jgi:hypothetical protein